MQYVECSKCPAKAGFYYHCQSLEEKRQRNKKQIKKKKVDISLSRALFLAAPGDADDPWWVHHMLCFHARPGLPLSSPEGLLVFTSPTPGSLSE